MDNRMKASLTIEMSLLIPLILSIFMGIILSVFYQYDKNILHGAAYETAAAGSLMMREKEEVTETELEALCRERLKGKLIFLTSVGINIGIEEEEIVVTLSARKGRYRALIEKRAAVTEPEKKIRDVRRLDIKNGKKNYD